MCREPQLKYVQECNGHAQSRGHPYATHLLILWSSVLPTQSSVMLLDAQGGNTAVTFGAQDYVKMYLPLLVSFPFLYLLTNRPQQQREVSRIEVCAALMSKTPEL